MPDLVILNITSVSVLDEKSRIEERKKKRVAAEAKRKVREHGRELEEAKRNLEKAQAELERVSEHPKTGICDMCGKKKPWGDFESTGNGISFCKECRADEHPKTGICDGCMKEKPWDEIENTRMGPRIMMCLCKECRSV